MFFHNPNVGGDPLHSGLLRKRPWPKAGFLIGRGRLGGKTGHRRQARQPAERVQRQQRGSGRQVQIDEPDKLAARLLPIIDAIHGTGVTTMAAISEALNERRTRTARGGNGTFRQH